MGFLDFLLGIKKKRVNDFLSRGAIILDVRTLREFNNGAIKGAKHIPLQELHNRVNEVKQWNKPVIVYCKAGVRAAKATKYLTLNNIEAINGGGILQLSKILTK